MLPGKPPKAIIKLAEVIDENLIKIEVTFACVFIIGLLNYGNQKDSGELFMTISLVILACAYYFLAFKNSENTFDQFMLKLINFSYTVAITSILFVLLNWPGGLLIQQAAMVALVLSLIGSLILGKTLKKSTIVANSDIYRTLIMLGLVLSLHFTPGYNKLKESRDTIQSYKENSK